MLLITACIKGQVLRSTVLYVLQHCAIRPACYPAARCLQAPAARLAQLAAADVAVGQELEALRRRSAAHRATALRQLAVLRASSGGGGGAGAGSASAMQPAMMMAEWTSGGGGGGDDIDDEQEEERGALHSCCMSVRPLSSAFKPPVPSCCLSAACLPES